MDTNLDIIHKLIQSTWLLVILMAVRIGLVWWVGCITLISVTILPSRTALCQPWSSTPIPITTDLIYTKLTSHLFSHNLSHGSQPFTPASNTHTHIHIYTSFENILMVEISIVKFNCTWFYSINFEIAMASWSAKKHSQWNKVNHPLRLVMRKFLLQN